MRIYRGKCKKCGQTFAKNPAWHLTPYHNTCDGKGLELVEGRQEGGE